MVPSIIVRMDNVLNGTEYLRLCKNAPQLVPAPHDPASELDDAVKLGLFRNDKHALDHSMHFMYCVHCGGLHSPDPVAVPAGSGSPGKEGTW
jgi:hypothetical protein